MSEFDNRLKDTAIFSHLNVLAVACMQQVQKKYQILSAVSSFYLFKTLEI